MNSTTSRLACVLLISMGCARATTLVAGTNPDPNVGFYVANDSSGVFSYEQLFTLSSAAQITSLSINAESLSAQTPRIQLFSGLGLEGTGTLLQTFNIDVPTYIVNSPTTVIPTSFSLGAGSYSLLLTVPSPSYDVIDQDIATSSNTPFGGLGGTHSSNGIESPRNIVFELAGNPMSAVPEPSSVLFLVTGLIAVAARSVRKQVQP